MLDLHLSSGQALAIETPSGDVEVCVLEVHPETSETTIEVSVPEEWETTIAAPTVYKLQEEFIISVPDGQIRIKVLRFRPRPDKTGGSVSLGIDAPRAWPVLR